MTPNLKVFGLAVMAALALSSIVVSGPGCTITVPTQEAWAT
jgi:hypothetical protein